MGGRASQFERMVRHFNHLEVGDWLKQAMIIQCKTFYVI